VKFGYPGYFGFSFSVSISYRFGSARLVGYDWFGSVGKKIDDLVGYNRMLSPYYLKLSQWQKQRPMQSCRHAQTYTDFCLLA